MFSVIIIEKIIIKPSKTKNNLKKPETYLLRSVVAFGVI